MHLYSGSSIDFIDQTQRNQIAGRLSDRFFEHFRYRPPESEVRSWQNSLVRMASVMELGGLRDQGVIVEYQLPLTSKRLDVMLTGHGAGGVPGAVVVELKQWDKVTASPIDECVETFVGARLRDVLHPSRQVGDYQQYLLDTHTAFTDGGIVLRSCGYLHNLKRANAAELYDNRFDDLVRQWPSFTGDDIDELVPFLHATVGEGGGADPLGRVLEGRYRPHRRLLEHTAAVIRNEPVFTLLDEQRVAFNHVLSLVRAYQLGDRSTVVLVRGGPGTGKSLIAVNLLAEMAAQGYVAVHATGSKAFTENIRKVVGSRAAKQFVYFNSFASAEPRSIDLLVCDEAHRIRETSNNRFTKRERRSEQPQIDELLEAAKVSVFLIDDMQIVRPGEVGSTDLIREAAEARGVKVVEHELEAQFRCNGSDAYVQWVDNTLELRKTPTVLWERDDPFDFDVVDSPEELDDLVRARADEGYSARLVAGFCWPWSKPNDDGTLVKDVKVDGWSRAWNARPEGRRLAPGIPKSNFWASDPGGIDQVGCVYTAQGFEFDYTGVIWGRDLVYRFDEGWVGQPEFSQDSVVRRSAKRSPGEFTRLVKHTYRVLLTRGLLGCAIYFEDEQTRDFVLSRTER
jgi:hypothetical protein